MNTIALIVLPWLALIVLPWLCGLTTLLTAAVLTMYRSCLRSEAVPARKVATNDPDKPNVTLGGLEFTWPGFLAFLFLWNPWTWPALWVIGIPLYSFLRWWLA